MTFQQPRRNCVWFITPRRNRSHAFPFFFVSCSLCNLICLKRSTLTQVNTNPVNYLVMWCWNLLTQQPPLSLPISCAHANSIHQLWMSEREPATSPGMCSDTAEERFRDWHIKMMVSRPCTYFWLTWSFYGQWTHRLKRTTLIISNPWEKKGEKKSYWTEILLVFSCGYSQTKTSKDAKNTQVLWCSFPRPEKGNRLTVSPWPLRYPPGNLITIPLGDPASYV